MIILNNFKKIINVYRVSNWYYYLGYTIIGFLLNNDLNSIILKDLFLSSSLLAFAFSLNDFYDKQIRKKYFLLPLILVFLLFTTVNIVQILISSIFLVIVTLYSTYPFKLKKIPFLSSFCNGIGFTMLFFIGFFHTQNNYDSILFAPMLFSFEIVAQFIHEVVHLKKDKKNKMTTTAVLLGENKIKKICYIFLWIPMLITIYLFYQKIINLIFVLTTFFFVIFFTIDFFTKKIDIKMREKYKFFGILVGIIYFISIL